jgi:hypothetical protein
MKNLKEFIALIHKYEAVTVKKLETCATKVQIAANTYSGFGNSDTCTLCVAVTQKDSEVNCSDCVYVKLTDAKCNGLPNRESYYNNGQLSYKANFVNGEKHGYWEDYYTNGQLNYKGNYVNGYKHGYWESYCTNGKLKNKTYYI